MNTPLPKRFAVIGNPIEHSRSPFIHAEFGRQTHISLEYDKLLSTPEQFTDTVTTFFNQGGSGLNVTVPFKENAWRLADELTPRARHAAAVNTLWMQNGKIYACNTDGEGLILDLNRLGHPPKGRSILLIGAGGAARGVVLPLLENGCKQLHIINRSPERARRLADELANNPELSAKNVSAGTLADTQGQWDIVINATSSSLSQAIPETGHIRYNSKALAYDMVYAAKPTLFMQAAASNGAQQQADGLGMLVAQAAASFAIWHGVQPAIAPVLNLLRAQL